MSLSAIATVHDGQRIMNTGRALAFPVVSSFPYLEDNGCRRNPCLLVLVVVVAVASLSRVMSWKMSITTCEAVLKISDFS